MESTCDAGDPGLIPQLGRSPGEGISCPLQYSWTSLCGSVGKESACNGRGPSAIPGLERSPGEGINCPLQYSWASLVAQLVKNPPAMQETWGQSWAGKIPWRRELATHSSILAWRIPWTEEPGGLQSMGVTKSQTQLSDFHFLSCYLVAKLCPTL